MPTDIGQMRDCTIWNVAGLDSVKRLLLKQARRHALAATCRQLQLLSLRHHLRHTEIIWDLSGATSDSVHATVPFNLLSSLHTQGLVDSVRGIGAVHSDNYLHRPSADKQRSWMTGDDRANWVDEPYRIVELYMKAAFIAFRLREAQDQYQLAHHKLFYRHIYRLQTFTDGNALIPIKKALRNTWKRDTMDVTLDISSEATSMQRMEEALSSLDIEHREKVAAVEIEIKRQEESSFRNGDHIFEAQHELYEQFVHSLDLRYNYWKERVRHFHQGLVTVVMLGCRIDHNDLHARLEEVRARFEKMKPRTYTGKMVVNAVLLKVQTGEDDEGSRVTR